MKSVMLFVEDQDKNEAQFMSASYVDNNVKNRVYLNTMGSELVMRYLNMGGIETSNLHNLHSISKIIEATDISDIMLSNIHIDVRVVFDEKQIFIPISHSELGIEPDVYVVLKCDKSFEKFNMIGYFTPDKINKKQKNSQYYFVDKKELSNPEKFVQFVETFSGKEKSDLTDSELLRGRSLSIALADHDITFEEKKELFALLLSSDKLRESILEFDNFETLSYNVASTVEDLKMVETATEEQDNEDEELNGNTQENFEQQEDSSETEDKDNEVIEDNDILSLEDNLEISQDNPLPDLDISADSIMDIAETSADIAKSAISGEEIPADAVTKGAMELAALAGELADSLPDVPFNEEENLQNFSEVKSDFDINNDKYAINNDYDSPKDLSYFEQINESVNNDFEQSEPLDFSGMETIEKDLPHDEEETVHLTDFDDTSIDDFNNIEINDEVLPEDVSDEIIEIPSEEPEVVEEEFNDQAEEVLDESIDTAVNDLAENQTEISEENSDVESLQEEPSLEYDTQDYEQEEVTEDTSANSEQEVQQEAQEWISDVDYEDLQDAPVDQLEPEINEDFGDYVEEKSEYKEPQVIENSIVISDKNFEVGEIEIDINKPEEQFLGGSEHLENLYNEEESMAGRSLLNGPGLLSRPSKALGLGIIGVITSLIIVGIIGISLSKMMKKPSEEVPQPVTDSSNTTPQTSNPDTLNVNEGNVINMDKVSPIAPSSVEHKANIPSQAQAPVANKQLSPTQFIEVSKLSWEAPDYVAANQAFRQYFQSAGKSLKLSLTSDLLLANEYIYSDQARVSINFGQDGSFKDAKILLSSGSQQVDKIVLQTVNQTLKVLKAPRSIGNDSGTTVILKIYF